MPVETKWAPGPWNYARKFDGDHWTDSKSIVDEEGSQVAILTRGWGCGMATANAHLIAAAPELYEALKDARQYVARAYECAFPNEAANEAILAAVDAALAKARGEK